MLSISSIKLKRPCAGWKVDKGDCNTIQRGRHGTDFVATGSYLR